MTEWASTRASHVHAALLRIGWSVEREVGRSFRVYRREGWKDFVWSFRDSDEIGPKMLARIASQTGLAPEHL
jgi:predicted RNA binding protein YcfA (HicA-like mRNA interferase family)